MRRFVIALAALLLVPAAVAAQNTPQIVCTDSTNTICTAKKFEPFTITADPALPTDTLPTEKWRLYQNGKRIAELLNAGAAPLFAFASGLPTDGEYQFYLEAIGTAFDATGQPVEVASGPSNTVKMTIVTGNLSAPKNLRVIKP